jgi:hypothetical protein
VKMFEEFAKPGMSFEMLRQEVDGDSAYIVWRAETADNIFELGSDTFIVRNGKIVTQTCSSRRCRRPANLFRASSSVAETPGCIIRHPST